MCGSFFWLLAPSLADGFFNQGLSIGRAEHVQYGGTTVLDVLRSPDGQALIEKAVRKAGSK